MQQLIRFFTLITCSLIHLAAASFTVAEQHPRVLLNPDMVKQLAKDCKGPLKDTYAQVKSLANRAVKQGNIKYIDNKWGVPTDLMLCGITYLIEKELGNKDAEKYAQPILKCWSNSKRLTDKNNCSFGFHALAYDWIYDAMSEEQRKKHGNALGTWLRWYTNKPEIVIKNGHWEYNQTWGVSHMNVMHARDAITQKLFIALAIHGAGTKHEQDAQQFLNSWNKRIPNECIPAFDAMGGSWAESHGHGAYGPIMVIPYAFEAWRTATGLNWFELGNDDTYLKEMSRWLTYLKVPHNDRHAYIDDGGGSQLSGFHSSAPVIAKVYNDPLAQSFAHLGKQVNAYKWGHIWQYLLVDARVKPATPKDLDLPLAYFLRGAGHVFMRSDWDDANATWAFFGAGPHRAGHQHDDEGHFMISKRGGLVGKAGGKGVGNDSDHYWGGSLVFNILTIFDPNEQFRRNKNNENDGGLRRLVYNNSTVERGSMLAYHHNDDVTYAAADLTKAYKAHKVKEVTRQFVYVRKQKRNDSEYFIVFDRVHGTNPSFKKHFILHTPGEPSISGTETVHVPNHVADYTGDELISSWLSEPQDMGENVKALSEGQSRIFMRTLLPANAIITKRGGKGHRNWGHPLEKTGQYEHHNKGRDKGPVANWRLEIAAPEAERSYFLHVFEITDAGVKHMSDITLEDTQDQITVTLAKKKVVTFSKNGDMSLTTTLSGKENNYDNSVHVTDQYKQWHKISK